MPGDTQADLFEIIRTMRSMRRLKTDPVLKELIRRILEAGTGAPSGGNMQGWRFLLVRDPQIKQTVGALYRRAWDEVVAPRYRSGEPAPGTDVVEPVATEFGPGKMLNFSRQSSPY